MHGSGAPSPWLERWASLLPATGTALDLACGAGRHLRWLAARGLKPTGIDRDAGALAACADVAGAELIAADVENGPWPCPGHAFDVVVVTNYLWRPLWPQIIASLAPGGVLLYETFADGNQTVGKPSRPDFLLQPGELLQRCSGLTIVGYEDGFLDAPPRFVQRVAAVRPAPGGEAHPRHRLPAG
ncbi:MAG TPA: class I SAM-dependent methyltransferase [Aquabacterium sp.]|nr:class I SAM-dependent methyltransferase [Aquabacterium sp.]HQC96963.1 class I SAM-dependent methyltransferase [Aquabacterium sp.]